MLGTQDGSQYSQSVFLKGVRIALYLLLLQKQKQLCGVTVPCVSPEAVACLDCHPSCGCPFRRLLSLMLSPFLLDLY